MPRVPRSRHKLLNSSYKLRPEDENLHTIAAIGWSNSTCKTLISNVSNTLPGSPADRPRHKLVMRVGEVVTEQELISISRPKCVEFMINYFSIIDIHDDHLRQGSLAMERRWRTATWWHRVFTTLIGFIFTNVYYAYCFEYRNANYNDTTKNTYSKLLGRLAEKIDLQHLSPEW